MAVRLNESQIKNLGINGVNLNYNLYVNGNTYTKGQIDTDNWIYFNNNTGCYWPNHNAARLYANDVGSYGALIVKGSRGGYNGILLGDTKNYMAVISDSIHQGLYNETNNKWIIYFNRSSDSIGLGTKTLISNNVVTIDGNAIIKNLLTVASGASHYGIKIGNTYINAINGDVIFQNNNALRFGSDSWNWDEWAGLKYDCTNKYIYLGIADNNIFTGNNVMSGGRILTPGISYFHVGNQTTYYIANDGSIKASSVTVDNNNSSGSIQLVEDGEGGTIRLYSKSNTYCYEIDAYNDETIRIHTASKNPNGTAKFISWNGKNGNVSTDGTFYVQNAYPVMPMKSANGFYGITLPDASDSDWIRTTATGIIPYQSGGYSALGTESWPFNRIYGNQIYGTLNGNASSATYAGYLTSNITFTPAESALTPANVKSLIGSGSQIRKGVWSYAGNGYIPSGSTATTQCPFGAIDLAGTTVIQSTTGTEYTQIYITPPTANTSGAIRGEMLYYIDQGTSYSPTWYRVLTNNNYSSYALPLAGGTMGSGAAIKFTGTAGSIAVSDPMSITYGRIAAYGTLCINANTDNSGTEYIILTAGKGLSSTTTDGLAIGTSTLTWQGATVLTSSNYSSTLDGRYVNATGDSMSGNLSFSAPTGGSTTPTDQRISINGISNDSSVANAPGIGFHIGGLNWGTLKFQSDGSFRFYNNGCTGYMPVYVSILNASSRIWTGYDSGVTNSVSCSNWFRSSGATGWYNATYDGGWYMSDTTWVRTHNSKGVYTGAGQIRSDRVDGGMWITGTHAAAFVAGAATSSAAGQYYQGWYSGKTQSGAWSLGALSGSESLYFVYGTDGNYNAGTNTTASVQFGSGGQVYGAVWNDYAEYRSAETIEPGRVVQESIDGIMKLTTQRLAAGCEIISDTFGFAIGETENCKTPVATSGRVLAYTFENRDSFELGQAVCSGPNGTVSKMTREEVMMYPERIIGTVSEIPIYTTWGTGNVDVNGRIWIRIR